MIFFEVFWHPNKEHTVDGRNPANQLMGKVVYPVIYQVLFTYLKWLFGIFPINSISMNFLMANL